MKLLIIGGTKFLGRHLIDSALARGHETTVFNRGRLVSDPIAGVENIRGDRHRELDKLSGRTWDAVIDTCGYLPQSLELSARALADSVGTYIFVSSISAYASFGQAGFDETAPSAILAEDQRERFASFDPASGINAGALGDAYGPLKAECERTAESIMPGRVLNVRPGLIVGPFDPTDRFTYWVTRVADGGEVLAPGKPGRFVQLIDARDLSDWIVSAAEEHLTGIFNAAGRPDELTMEQMLQGIKRTTGSDAEFTWVDEQFLTAWDVAPWSDLPLYLTESDTDSHGFLRVNVDRALSTGLAFRPFDKTVRDTLEWRRTDPSEMRAGIDRTRETELLKKWHEQER